MVGRVTRPAGTNASRRGGVGRFRFIAVGSCRRTSNLRWSLIDGPQRCQESLRRADGKLICDECGKNFDVDRQGEPQRLICKRRDATGKLVPRKTTWRTTVLVGFNKSHD